MKNITIERKIEKILFDDMCPSVDYESGIPPFPREFRSEADFDNAVVGISSLIKAIVDGIPSEKKKHDDDECGYECRCDGYNAHCDLISNYKQQMINGGKSEKHNLS